MAAASHRGSNSRVTPFERIFDDHGIYLGACSAEMSMRRSPTSGPNWVRASRNPASRRSRRVQTLVNLLVRLGRLEVAIEVASEYLADLPDSRPVLSRCRAALPCRAGDPHRLATIARDHRDLVNYTAALIQTIPGP
jgi:hypothetical protein